MNPIEQLKSMHTEAKDRLSKHPDYILMRSLETLIENLEGHSTTWEGGEAPSQSATQTPAPATQEVTAIDDADDEIAVETESAEPEATPTQTAMDESSEAADLDKWNEALADNDAKDLEVELAQDLEIELASETTETDLEQGEADVVEPKQGAASA